MSAKKIDKECPKCGANDVYENFENKITFCGTCNFVLPENPETRPEEVGPGNDGC